MALEALSTASNIAGLVNLGFSVCYGIWTYYGTWRDAESDMRKMYSSIETLTKSFAILKDALDHPYLNSNAVQRVNESIAMCEDGIGSLQKKLKKIRATPTKTDRKWNAKAKVHWQRALYPFRESTLVKLKELSNELQSHLSLALEILQIDASAMSLQALDKLSSQMSEMSLDIQNLDSRLSQASTSIAGLAALHADQRLLSVHSWLSPLHSDFDSKHRETINTPARQDGLGNWLLGQAEYQQWQQSTGEMLWCCGPRGVGKTVLASFVIDNVRKTESSSVGTAFVYCKYNDPQKQTAINIIGSVLQQLMLQNDSLATALAACYDRHQKDITNPSIVEYSALLQSAIGLFTKCFLIIDALDECRESNRDTIMDVLNQLRPRLSLFVTSRYALVTMPRGYTGTSIALAANDLDIRKYIGQRVNTSAVIKAYSIKDSSLHDYIVSRIAEQANGMFLLARLQLDSVMAKPTLRRIKSALNNPPERLDSLYDQALERIHNQNPEYVKLALKLLCWVHHAVRPLKLQELRHALAVEDGDDSFDEEGLPDEKLLESICGGMINLQENDTVGLVHYTAQEYLEQKLVSLSPRANLEIAQVCLTYLSFDDFTDGPCTDGASFEDRKNAYPLFQYASQHWADHLRGEGEVELEDMILKFFGQRNKLMASLQATWVARPYNPDWVREWSGVVDGLWLASLYGLRHTCSKLLEKGGNVNSYSFSIQTPLHCAAISGHVDVAQLLLENNADIEAQRYDGYFEDRTPLHLAAIYANQEVAKLLLSRGALVEACDKVAHRTPLHYAARSGCKDIVALILRQNTDINVRDTNGETPLDYAAREGHQVVTRVLLEKGAKTDSRNVWNATALHHAAKRGYMAVIRSLLDHGANPRSKAFSGQTPLILALSAGHTEVASLLAKASEAASDEEEGQDGSSLSDDSRRSKVFLPVDEKTRNPASRDYSAWKVD